MASFKRIGATAGLVLGAAAGLVGVGLLAVLRRSLPRTSGTLTLPGLRAPVQVLRDRWGIPHIYAKSNHDLFMAQGYVHAQDRLWQMEFNRRTGLGQLSEIFGEVALESDRFLRVMGFGRVARREVALLDDATREVVDAYVQGVNAYITQHANRLPIEFTLLRLRPRPWEPADVLVWGKMMALSLSENWALELLRAQIVAAIGPERAAQLETPNIANQPLIIPPGLRYTRDIGNDALQGAAAAASFLGAIGQGQGSNNWVVHGSRSTSGMPLLANDPHLAAQMPALWYENHLNGGDYHVTGASIPGTPGVVIGHNERIAWGVTNGMTDVQDVYVERFDPQDPTRYLFNGQWEQAEVEREEIHVKGRSEPHIEEVRITRHGPVISPLAPLHTVSTTITETHHEALALRWTALQPSTLLSSVLELNRAHNWQTFRAALAKWDVPAQNFVYADVEGQIGYVLAGAMPIRAKGDGRLPVPGWNGEYEWIGMIPPAEMPHVLNPESGYFVTANNCIVGDDYPYLIAGEWLNGYRAERIDELLKQQQQHDADSFKRIQGDFFSIPGKMIASLAERLSATNVTSQHARDALAAWDGELSAESVGGRIYAELREQLLNVVLAELAEPLNMTVGLGAFQISPGLQFKGHLFPEVLRCLIAGEQRWLPAGTTWDEVLNQAWEATITNLRAEYGDDVRLWLYGRKHTISFNHPLAVMPALAKLLNRGPFPYGGDADTVCQVLVADTPSGQQVYIVPSYRQICDTADWNKSQSIFTLGQSGQPGSRHYADQLQHWLRIEYHPMLWSRANVEAAATDRLTLAPEAT
jgi:penicillin amidase